MAKLMSKKNMAMVGMVLLVLAGVWVALSFTNVIPNVFVTEGFEGAMVGDMMDNGPMLAGQEDMVLHNEENKKLQEMEEMNALGCPGMLLTELDPGSVNSSMAGMNNGMNGDKTNPGYMVEHMTNSTGLPGSDVQSSVGAEVQGFIGDNRQFPQFPSSQLDAGELLPKEQADQFAQLFPEGMGHLSNRRDFLTSGFHIGINTVGQTLRNANYQLRSDPPNPQTVTTWMNNPTITPDLSRRVLEIGSDC